MPFNPNLKLGQELINEDIINIFKCGPQGGMRRSHKTNTLILISDRTRGIYEDIWENNILHYIGMGQIGNQSLDFQQNKTLYESDTNGVDVFLFEVFESKKYIFQGKVKLSDKPYIEKQPDLEKNFRDVWIFPLELIDNTHTPLISDEQFKKKIEIIEKKAKKLSLEDLNEKILSAPKTPGSRDVVSKQYDRNPYVAEYAKRRANGKCELCNVYAPFNDKHGEPFLEVHHIDWLSKGSSDTINNTVALCPNCHRKMHILDLEKDKMNLLNKASKST